MRRRASNQSTEAAAGAIAQFLEVSANETDSHGWMLISTVNLLAAGGDKIVDVMTTASVPSTLVKCLYLFFDLAATEEPLLRRIFSKTKTRLRMTYPLS